MGLGRGAQRVVRQGGAPPCRRGTGPMSTGTKRTKGKMSTKRTKKNTESTMNRKGNEAPVEVTPETVVDMLGAPAHPDGEVTRLAGRPGVAVGLCRTAAGGCDVVSVEATRMPGSRALTLTGRLGRHHPLRSSAPGRRHRVEGAGRARCGLARVRPAAREPQAGRRGSRRRPSARGRDRFDAETGNPPRPLISNGGDTQ